MAELNNADQNDRVNMVYETKIGEKTEIVELPFKILVIGDFTRDERSEFFDQQLPILLNKHSNNIDVLFKQLQPKLHLTLQNKLQADNSEIIIELAFTSLDDFSPAHILSQHGALQTILKFTESLSNVREYAGLSVTDEDRSLIEAVLNAENISVDDLLNSNENTGWLISSIEERICQQLDCILHHHEFKNMEAAWRSLEFLINRTQFNENCEIAVVNISKQGLADDFDDVPEIIQSKYYQLVYSDEFGQFGGRPYGAIIGNYAFNPKAPDIKLLSKLASVSAVAHAPFIAAASAEFFDIDSYSKFSRLRDLASIFSQPAYIKWNSFQQTPDARYVALTLPSFLLRESYKIEIGSLIYNEKNKDKDKDVLWGNAAFAFATRLMDSFAKYRWCLNCTGKQAGLVDQLNMSGGKIPTQFILTDRRESDVVSQGFIPLSIHKGDDSAAFYSAYSTYKIEQDKTKDELDLSDRLAAQLPYLMIISRISHYLKLMQREHIGSWRNRRDLDQQLNKWLAQYVSDMDNPAAGVRARRPLRAAEVKVREVEGKQDWFVTKISITPHLKYMGNSFHLSEVSKMEKN